MFLLEALFVQGGQVHMHRRLEVAVEYGLFWPFERLFSPYFTATHDWCKVTCPRCTRVRSVPKCRIVGNAFYQIWHLSAIMFIFTADGDISYRLPNCVET